MINNAFRTFHHCSICDDKLYCKNNNYCKNNGTDDLIVESCVTLNTLNTVNNNPNSGPDLESSSDSDFDFD